MFYSSYTEVIITETCTFFVPFLFVPSQVQLLVQDSDVESYKQIKGDLDDLRNLVEKSELWVYKGRSTDAAAAKGKKKKKKDDEEEPRECAV